LNIKNFLFFLSGVITVGNIFEVQENLYMLINIVSISSTSILLSPPFYILKYLGFFARIVQQSMSEKTFKYNFIEFLV